MRKSIGIMSDFKIFFLAVYHLNREQCCDETCKKSKYMKFIQSHTSYNFHALFVYIK